MGREGYGGGGMSMGKDVNGVRCPWGMRWDVFGVGGPGGGSAIG